MLLQPPPTNMPNDVKTGRLSSYASHLTDGVRSGVLSAIILQPLDLLKTRVQQSGHSSLGTTFSHIWKRGGFFALYRGTVPSTLRTGAGSAFYFATLNGLREEVARSNLPGVLTSKNPRAHHSSSLPQLSNVVNLTTGAVARTFAGFLLMPMTIIKVRYESNLYAYRSMWGAIKDIMKTQGVKGFYTGFYATAWRDAPYAALQICFYEQSKERLSRLSQAVPLPGEKIAAGMNVSKSTSINFASGVIAAGLATVITNPIDAIKTRIQLESSKYHSIVQAAKLMLRNDGAKSLFDGMGLRMGRKALSSGVVWTMYEELRRKKAKKHDLL